MYRKPKKQILSYGSTQPDRKLIESKTIYSFRFANACHPEFYKTFETKAHHLFLLIKKPRHHYHGWYKYIGTDLQDHIDKLKNYFTL